MSKIEMTDYRKVDCQLWKDNPAIFMGLYKEVNGNVCDGCGFNLSNECKGYREIALIKNHQTAGLRKYKTNAELAAELGVSKRQVSKMRKFGTI